MRISVTLFQRIPATVYVLCAVLSVQLGAALARPLFGTIGAAGTVFLRLAFASVIFTLIFRPKLLSIYRNHWRIIGSFAITIAASTGFFYVAVQRIPLGIAISVEFLGPLLVAVWHSRSWRDRMWVVIAAISIALLVPDIGDRLDVWGVLAALCAACFWGMYIVVSPRVSAVLPAFDGLVAAVIIATGLMCIPGIWQGGWQLVSGAVLWQSALMALAAAVIPFACEFYALRRMPARTYGILVCTEPIAGALIGWIVLGEALHTRAIFAIIGITIASLGSTLTTEELHV